MKKTFYQTHAYSKDHSCFGGRIFSGDFDRKLSLSDIAGRIISDQCFDRECERNAKSRDWNQNNEQKAR